MSGDFFDTNILVYAYDASAGEKHTNACKLLTEAIDRKSMLISLQVLMELYVTITKKSKMNVPEQTAAEIIKELSAFCTFCPKNDDLLEACRFSQKHMLSLWDSLILHAAATLETDTIWSEDLQHGFTFEGVKVKNPFLRP